MHNGTTHSQDERRLFWAAAITGTFMIAEVAGGLLAGSLALVADSVHMLTDFISLGFAWFALRLAHRPADFKRTYGFARFQILVAFTNGISLFFIVAWIFFEAIHRLFNPIIVIGSTMLVIATLGLVANLVVFKLLHGADQENLNIRGAILHVMSDLLGSGGALAAAGIILLTGWFSADPLFSLLVVALILGSAGHLVKKSGHILLEGAPPWFDVTEVGTDLIRNISGLVDVHHIHAWLLTQEQPMVTLHARVAEIQRSDSIILDIKRRLKEKYDISHATIQVEYGPCKDHPNTLTG
ncbi:cation transporter [Candidatus Acetothermia bacterium]|nr:cation transporter [Candidatus Acetothermia bacterium]MBI3643011.1 cation transporter [Candidatus Acetothermia bacterium]